MRKTRDRIRHAISFEVFAIALVAPLGALVFDLPVSEMGVVAVGGAAFATLWNYVYNLGFDHAMRRLGLGVDKTLPVRIVHATIFEAALVLLLAPPVAWYLEISLLQALVMDLGLASFFLVYAFVFNLAYDFVFPVPGGKREAARRLRRQQRQGDAGAGPDWRRGRA